MPLFRENRFRTVMCGEVTEEEVGHSARACGWVASRRDHGGLIFIDLRDRSGVLQVVADPRRSPQAHRVAEELRDEYVVRVQGRIVSRPPGRENPRLPTGTVELEAEDIEILSTSPPPPFPIEDGIPTAEEVRLRYRYLDLRRPEMQRALALRHHFLAAVRRCLDRHGFFEVETPFLGKSTPEGARDYLVPSRLNPGSFYALPQSPQLYKQLLMIAGVDRYYQIARCMRDEDSRKDRQPEFTQIDLEMSFVEADDVFAVCEEMLREGFAACGIEIEVPFPRLTYAEAVDRYGTDKPDLRYRLELAEVSDIAGATGFRVFRSALEAGGIVKALAAPGWAARSRREMDELAAEAARLGAKGLGYVKVEEGKPPAGPVAKFLSPAQWEEIRRRTGAGPGDMVIFSADRPQVVNPVLAWLRQRVAEEAGLVDPGRFVFHWITDFPLFTWSEEEKRWVSEHHPFTSPHPDDADLLETEPGKVRSASYDLVINGYECGSGSIRIHEAALQERVFRVLRLGEEEIRRRFGFFIDALKYGAPPHGGIALGVDRIIAVITGRQTIRDVIAFPKTQRGQDLMSGAPSPVDPRQLRELHIALLDDEERG